MATTTSTRPRQEPRPQQLGYLIRLARERVVASLGATPDERERTMHAQLAAKNPSRAEVSHWIDILLGLPEDEAGRPQLVGPGVYELPTGEIFVVKLNREKTRVYAKKLVEIGGTRLTETDEHVQIEFEYAPGAIHRLREEHRMPLDRAKALTLRYGRCINCGTRLVAAKSVEEGIGPVCRKQFKAYNAAA